MATTQVSPQSALPPPVAGLPPRDHLGNAGNGMTSFVLPHTGVTNVPGIVASAAPPSEDYPSAHLVRSANSAEAEAEEAFLQLSPAFARMPVGLVVSVPIRDFRVRNLLAMASGTVVETQWGYGEDLPLSSGPVQLAWTEFEVVDARLAVRVTRLA